MVIAEPSGLGGRPARIGAGGRGFSRSKWAAPWRMLQDWLDRPLTSLHLILGVFALMLGFGLVMVLSSSAATAFKRSDSSFSVFTSQAIFAALGLVAMVAVSRMPLGFVRRLSTPGILVALTLLVAVLIPHIGTKYNGARSWITISSSMQFQPSEVAKLALLLWAGHVLATVHGSRRRLWSLMWLVGFVFVVMVGLIMLEPDLGTTVALSVIFLAVLYFAGAPLWLFGMAGGLGLGAIIYLATSAGYRVDRLTAWLHPATADPDLTYQTFQGYYALGSGGIFGVGIGQSKMKWGRLPNADSDYIFAIIGEELGLIGTLTVVVLFAVLAYTGLRIARRNVDPFVKIVAAAGTLWLVGQATINVAYVVGLLPVTGIPLPMFSTGGTSLVITMVVFGLLVNFARREPQAAAALHGVGGRGLAAFLGFGAPAGGRSVPRRVARRRARRDQRDQRDQSEARTWPEDRFRREQRGQAEPGEPQDVWPAEYEPAPAARRVRDGQHFGSRPAGDDGQRDRRPPGAAGSRRVAGRATPRYRIRRALGFPVPGERPVRAGSGRPTRPGRTVRP